MSRREQKSIAPIIKNFYSDAMFKIFYSIALMCLIGSTANGFSEQEIALSHTEGRGLGYSIGYSSLKLFLSQPFAQHSLEPFIDLRGHLFNNGRQAANAALGCRYTDACEQVWGMNIAFDYLENSRRTYKQVGAGFEWIGAVWDLRLNGYLPMGSKKTNIYRFSYAFLEELKKEQIPSFNFGLKAREQLALNGVDAMFGRHFCLWNDSDLHFSAGPYYYLGNTAKTKNAFRSKYRSAFGGRLLLELSFNDYLAFKATSSYDSIFKWCGQAVISLSIPFDFFAKQRCPTNYYRKKNSNFIQRNEIIAVDCLNRFTNDPRVLDPEFHP